MRRIFISFIIALSMVATPLLAAAISPLSCDGQECCQAMEAHHDIAGMLDEVCQCHMVPLSPCHIAADPQSPQLAIPLPTDRGQFQNLMYMNASVDAHPDGSLPGAFALANQVLRPDIHPPPIYLLTCSMII